MKYAYLASSLPLLKWSDSPPFSTGGFRNRCQGVLTVEDAAELDLLLSGDREALRSDFGTAWVAADTQLRNAIVRYRSAAAGEDASPHLRIAGDFDSRIEAAVEEAFSKADPMERENRLDRCRWEILEEMASKAPFSAPAVFAFGLKLQLSERWERIRGKSGRDAFETLVRRALAERGFEAHFEEALD